MGRRRTPEPDRPPTLATIAAAVGVSRMTVSNAYNRPDQLSPALREKILAAAHELGYGGPDPVARTLSRGRTGSVGLVFDYPLTLALRDPATVELLHGVAAGCEQRERALSLVPRIAGRDAELVHTALVDGFVIYCMPESDPRLDAVRERRLPHVLVDHRPEPGTRTVNIDDRGGARATADHLTGLGHRRLGIVDGWDKRARTGPEAEAEAVYYVNKERMAGWRAGAEAVGIDWGSVQTASGPGFDRATGRVAALRMLDLPEPPTAIVTYSDRLARGVLDAAAERGVRVPQELSVAGFDDVPEAARSLPPLTTVRQPHTEKGASAVRLLLDDDAPGAVRLPVELVVRRSTGPPP